MQRSARKKKGNAQFNAAYRQGIEHYNQFLNALDAKPKDDMTREHFDKACACFQKAAKIRQEAYYWLARLEYMRLTHYSDGNEYDIEDQLKEYMLTFANEYNPYEKNNAEFIAMQEYYNISQWLVEQAKRLNTLEYTSLSGYDDNSDASGMSEDENNYFSDSIDGKFLDDFDTAAILDLSISLLERLAVENHFQVPDAIYFRATLLEEISNYSHNKNATNIILTYLIAGLSGKMEAFDDLIRVINKGKNDKVHSLIRKIKSAFEMNKHITIDTIKIVEELNNQLHIYYREIELEPAITLYSDIKLVVAEFILFNHSNQDLLNYAEEFLNSDFGLVNIHEPESFKTAQKKLRKILKEKKNEMLISEREKEKENEKEKEKDMSEKASTSNMSSIPRRRNKRNKNKNAGKKNAVRHPIYKSLRKVKWDKELSYHSSSESVDNDNIENLQSMKIWEIDLPDKIKSVLNNFDVAYLVGGQARERLRLGNRDLESVENQMRDSDIDIVTSSENIPADGVDQLIVMIEEKEYIFERSKHNYSLFVNYELHIDIYFCQQLKNSITASAQARDFTINALYIDPNGNVFAPIKQSEIDLIKGHIRPIDKHIYEKSPVCILRHACLRSHGYVDAPDIEDLSAYIDYLDTNQFTDGARTSFLNKILLHGKAEENFSCLMFYGLQNKIFPGINDKNMELLREDFRKTDSYYDAQMQCKGGLFLGPSSSRVFSNIIAARIRSDIDIDDNYNLSQLATAVEQIANEYHLKPSLREKLLTEKSLAYIKSKMNMGYSINSSSTLFYRPAWTNDNIQHCETLLPKSQY